jgi:hydroxyacylglutathione hydrolase
MKKALKWIAIVFGVIIILLAAGYFWLSNKIKQEREKLNAHTTQVLPGIACVLDQYVNLFLVKSATGYIAIDAGMNADTIKRELDNLKIKPEDIKYVFVTHTDRDHVGGIKLFSNATVYISDKEEQMINGTTNRAPLNHNSLAMPYKMLSDGDTLNADGVRIRGILTPGHTPGSMCFIVNDSMIVIGDAFSLDKGEVRPFNEFFTMDTKTHIESIKKLSKLEGIKHIYTAHYGFVDFKDAFKNGVTF